MQKFQKGDLVRIAKDLGSSMSHFPADRDAIVIGSYKDQFGGDNTDSYTLHLKGKGRHSWYYERQLTLIEPSRLDMLQQWSDEEAAECDQKSNLDWIFANGKDVFARPHGASIASLAKCIGIDNLWGSNGEGINYHLNSMTTLQLAEPFLNSNDKDGWLKFCYLMMGNYKIG